jgi:hypothetical protein
LCDEAESSFKELADKIEAHQKATHDAQKEIEDFLDEQDSALEQTKTTLQRVLKKNKKNKKKNKKPSLASTLKPQLPMSVPTGSVIQVLQHEEVEESDCQDVVAHEVEAVKPLQAVCTELQTAVLDTLPKLTLFERGHFESCYNLGSNSSTPCKCEAIIHIMRMKNERLIQVAKSGKSAAAQMAIYDGARADVPGIEGLTALQVAEQAGHQETLQAMRDALAWQTRTSTETVQR